MSTAVTESRKARARSRDAIGMAAQALASAQAAVAEAKIRNLREGRLAELQRREEQAAADLAGAKREERAARARVEEALGESRTAPLDRFSQLDSEVPVGFFPLRIETRFRRGSTPSGASAPELLVRIYPDSVLADEHEPLLTAAEVEAGRAYWRRAWADGDERDAWTLLLKSAMAPRAAWIVSQTGPANAAERPASGENPAPQFGDTPTRPEGWHRAPEARGLPERWIVTAYRDSRRIRQMVSEPVREGLALTIRLSGDGGPDDDTELVDLTGDGLHVEASVLWAYDFDEAVRAGMAVVMPVSDEDMRLGFSQLLVMGVRTSEEPEVQAAELSVLMTAQNAMRGVAFAPQGSKTNNTSENPSDYPPADVAGAVSFATYRGTSLALPDRDGDRFMGALGLERETAAHFWGADRDEQTGALAMFEALWPATIGYFLRQMMAPSVTPALAGELRAWGRAHVRARGPYPAFCVGPAPYGLLPIGPLFQWSDNAAGEGLERELPAALQRLARIWRTAAEGVPRVGRTGDPEADLVEVLAMDASTQSVQIRRALGYETVWNIWSFHGLDLTSLEETKSAIARDLLHALGDPSWNPRVLHLKFADKAYDFAGPLIEDRPLSETERLVFNYIAWLRTASIADLKDQKSPPFDPPVNALLYFMLRHALLSEYDASAKRILEWRGLLQAGEMREAELVDIAPSGEGASPQRSAWDRFGMTIGGVTDGRTLGEVIADPRPVSPTAPPLQQALGEVAALRDAFQALETLPTAELHRLFGETLDLSSHRLDAWLIAFYHKRLKEMRERRPHGLYIGCYGWVEDLRPDPPSADIPAIGPDGSPVDARPDIGGYILAPSMLQAAAAAVLRSAYLARSGPAQGAYAIDLSSRRVRTALWLVDTVRDDQPLGAALGYQFERGLHERHPGVELDQFINDLRGLYPLTANKAEDSGQPADSVAARNVVDGLRLHAAWRAGGIPYGAIGLSPDSAQRAAIDAELALLDDAVDAVGDLMTAEAVYQVIKGSAAGAAATLDSLGKGTRPPEIEVASTPRGGAVLHQRYVIALGDGSLPPEWAGVPISPRAAAAPELNAWLARLFGPPDAISCLATPSGAAARDVTVADLGLQAIDFFHLARGAELGEGAADLDARIAWRIAGPAGPDVSLAIDYDAAATTGATTFGQAFEIASAIGSVMGFARPLAPRDLLPPEMENRSDEADSMVPELEGRASTVLVEVNATIVDLTSALATASDFAAIRAALLRAAQLGVPGAFPTSRHDAGAGAALVSLANAALATLRTRQEAALSAQKAGDRLQACFGGSFTVVARFRPAAPELLIPALGQEPDLGAQGAATVEGWIAGLGRVREPVAAWRCLVLYQRALGRMQDRPRIVQLPLETDPVIARWAALPFEGGRPRAGLVSLAIDGGPAPAAGDAWSALLLDSWPELMPNVEEDAGVAFHHDAPGGQAPQAVLLAVSPPGRTAWSFDLLEQTLLHALDLAKLRTVDLTNLGAFGQLTPMSFLTANPANAAIATSLAGLTAASAVITAQEG